MANSFNSAQINFKTLTCAQAKEMFVGDQWETFEESQMLELVIKNCNALTHNVKNPENPRKIIVYVDAQNGEQYILWLVADNDVDVHFLTSLRKYDEEVVKEEVKTKLPHTYDNNTILIIFAIVVVAIVAVSIRIAVLKKKEMSK